MRRHLPLLLFLGGATAVTGLTDRDRALREAARRGDAARVEVLGRAAGGRWRSGRRPRRGRDPGQELVPDPHRGPGRALIMRRAALLVLGTLACGSSDHPSPGPSASPDPASRSGFTYRGLNHVS